MTFFGGIDHANGDGPDSIARVAGAHEHEQRASHLGRLGTGTLACSRCDAPVAIGPHPLSAADRLTCPFCNHAAPLRDFLSLAPPTRPARVVVRVGQPGRRTIQQPTRSMR